jgi:hypothetical protein
MTLSELLEHVKQFEALRQTWLEIDPEQSPDLFTESGERVVSGELIEAVLDLDEVITGDVAREALTVAIALDDCLNVWREWAENIASSQHVTPDAHPAAPQCWAAWQDVMTAALPVQYRHPEPISQMQQEGLATPERVADIYGFYTPEGGLDLVKAAEEIQTPGTHYNAGTWISPEVERTHARNEAEWSRRNRKTLDKTLFGAVDQTKSGVDRSEWSEPPAPTETLEEFARMPNMTYAQISRALNLEIDEVIRRCNAMGVALSHGQVFEQSPELDTPQNRAKPIADLQKELDRQNRMKHAGKDRHREKDLTGQIIAMANDDPQATAGDLWQMLRENHHGLELVTVETVLDSFRAFSESLQQQRPPQMQSLPSDSAEPRETTSVLDRISDFDLPSIESQLASLTRDGLYHLAKTYEIEGAKITMSAKNLRKLVSEHIQANAPTETV